MKTVPLHGKRARGRVALVDDGDYDLVMRYRWHVWEDMRNGRLYGPYAHAKGRGAECNTLLQMHRLITGYERTDHIDRNGLNNQRSNLRPATQAQNTFNVGPRQGYTSSFKGVSWYKTRGLWIARISAYRRSYHLGYFADEEAAARAYDAAARELHGEFAYQNFPSTEAEHPAA